MEHKEYSVIVGWVIQYTIWNSKELHLKLFLSVMYLVCKFSLIEKEIEVGHAKE